MTKPIYLIPEELGPGGMALFPNAKQIGDNTVAVKGFKLYTFIRRLDKSGFNTYCVALKSKERTVSLIKIQFADKAPDFGQMGFLTTETPQGIVIHISRTTFDVMDNIDKAFTVKSGNWKLDRQRYHSLAAMHYLGAIPQLSPPVFANPDNDVKWETKLHTLYGTFGEIRSVLKDIYRRIAFALKFFCIQSASEILDSIELDHDFCFGQMYEALSNSLEVSSLANILPGCSEMSPYYVIYSTLRAVCGIAKKLNLGVKDIDDVDGLTNAIHSFQESNGIHVGGCDVKTVRRLVLQGSLQRYEQLPIFRMAGIGVQVMSEPDFPMVQPIGRPESDPLAEQVRVELNRVTTAVPDPAAKLDWAADELERSLSGYNARCAELALRVGDVEQRVVQMNRQLSDVSEEAAVAAKRFESASRTLVEVFEAHNRIQSKFDALRDKLYSEQRSTRLILIVGIFITLLGAIGLRF